MGRVILVAVDSSPQSQAAALWAAHNLAQEGDSVHLACVAPPPAYTMTPAAPIASAGAVSGPAGKGALGGVLRGAGLVVAQALRCAAGGPWPRPERRPVPTALRPAPAPAWRAVCAGGGAVHKL